MKTIGPGACPVGLEAAWREIWKQGARHHLPTLLDRRLRRGGVELAPLRSLSLPATSSIKLLRKDPWGIVAIELHDLQLVGLDGVTGGALGATAGAPGFFGELTFPSLRLTGRYRVQTGGSESAAARTMVDAIAGRPRATVRDAGVPLLTPAQLQQGLTNASTHRDNLAATPNGVKMLGAYYDNNDTFNTIMSDQVMSYVWVNNNPNGGVDPTTQQPYTSGFFAGTTVVATQPGSNQNINGSPDNTGNSPYNLHSFYQANQIIATAKRLQRHAPDQNTYQALQNAIDATINFIGNTQGTTQDPGPSWQPQTQASVMNAVASGRQLSVARHARQAPPENLADLEASLVLDDDPAWYRQVVRMALTDHDEIVQKGTCRGVPVALRREHAIGGTFSAALPAFDATLHGRQSADGDITRAHFQSLEAAVSEPRLALDGEPSDLLAAVHKALDGAAFLRAILQRQTRRALQSSSLIQHINAAIQFTIRDGGAR